MTGFTLGWVFMCLVLLLLGQPKWRGKPEWFAALGCILATMGLLAGDLLAWWDISKSFGG